MAQSQSFDDLASQEQLDTNDEPQALPGYWKADVLKHANLTLLSMGKTFVYTVTLRYTVGYMMKFFKDVMCLYIFCFNKLIESAISPSPCLSCLQLPRNADNGEMDDLIRSANSKGDAGYARFARVMLMASGVSADNAAFLFPESAGAAIKKGHALVTRFMAKCAPEVKSAPSFISDSRSTLL